MDKTIAIVLIVALFSDTAANIARMIGVILGLRAQDRMLAEAQTEQDARVKVAGDIIQSTVNETLNGLADRLKHD